MVAGKAPGNYIILNLSLSRHAINKELAFSYNYKVLRDEIPFIYPSDSGNEL